MDIFIVRSDGYAVPLGATWVAIDWCGIARNFRRAKGVRLEAENADKCSDVRKMRGWARKRSALDFEKESARRREVKAALRQKALEGAPVEAS